MAMTILYGVNSILQKIMTKYATNEKTCQCRQCNTTFTEREAITTQEFDESVIGARAGCFYRMLYHARSQDLMTTTGEVVRALSDTGATIAKIDEVGLGAGVLDRLVEQGRPAAGINAGKPARDAERFANARAQLYWGLRERFRDGLVEGLADELTYQQLASIQWDEMPGSQRVRIESKEDMQAKRGLPSPDRAEALMLAYAELPEPKVHVPFVV
ncbi:hypothetical protein LCGC14_2781500 [marine sediment metagenome]|uniref:Uncharacterized protein n=1 Tax=marine sediment metagenome TaxID=412755 RepID=A0A0F9B1S4_9ZZZZ